MYCCCKKYVPGRESLFPFLLPPLVALHKRNCREAEGGSTVHLVGINVFRHPIQLKPWLDDCRAALYLCTFSQSPLTKPPLTTCRWKKSLLTTVFSPPPPFIQAVHEHQHLRETLHVCLPPFVRVRLCEPHCSQDVCF